MDDEEEATLDGQFAAFAKLFETKDHPREGTAIDLYRNDYWFRQAKILDGKIINTQDTGTHFYKLDVGLKSEINWDEWNVFLDELCMDKELDEDEIKNLLTNCGTPGTSKVVIPKFKELFELSLIKEPKND